MNSKQPKDEGTGPLVRYFPVIAGVLTWFLLRDTISWPLALMAGLLTCGLLVYGLNQVKNRNGLYWTVILLLLGYSLFRIAGVLLWFYRR
jgi:NADH:ubiquinone oxidoreductase subunit 4 (subunit M)